MTETSNLPTLEETLSHRSKPRVIKHEMFADNFPVNSSTRSLHTQLNKLILVRLPLALPPHTTNSSKYVSGLLHIAPIYITFESLWQEILESPCLPTSLKQATVDTCEPGESKRSPETHDANTPRKESSPKVCSRTSSLLSHLLLPGLPRADRLRADIRILTGKSELKVEEQLKAISRNGELANFIAHTKASVQKNPHVLVAYAWVLYMALFSGGRYLRASLRAAGGLGKDFWDREPSPVRPHIITRDMYEIREPDLEPTEPLGQWPRVSERGRAKSWSESDLPKMTPGLLFFDFAGDEDGEDIKVEFKKRVVQADLLLTPREKDDVVAEAQDIFRFMLKMVDELDTIMKTTDEDLEMSKLFLQSPNLMATRDSVVVAQERFSRKASHVPEKETNRKPSYLDVLFTGPMAKLVTFNGASPRVSFVHDDGVKDSGSGSLDRNWIQRHFVMVPILGTFIFLILWYVGV